MSIANQKTILSAVITGLLAGCATQSKVAKQQYHFFPPPPDEPRLQFLTAFSSEKDFRGKDQKTLMTFLTGEKPPDKDFGKPYGAAANDKRLYICDTELNAVLVADFQGRRIDALDAQGDATLKTPLNITFDAEGLCYVTDSGRDQVIILDKNKKYLATIGKTGEMKPRDVAVSSDRIYVADMQKHGVRVFDKTSRNLLFDIPQAEDATNRTRGLFMPTNLALDSKGNLYVGDTGAFRVQVYDREGKYVRSVGEMGDRLGQFARIKGIAVDRDNRLYAVDAMSQVVQVFNEEGRLLTWFADPDSTAKVQELPAKILVDYEDVNFFQKYAAPNFKLEYLVIVINQLGFHKVSIYGFGHKA